jgi:NAD(P)-dependent dehydrogenase (short-subunit alcohol dehydrogenase family)
VNTPLAAAANFPKDANPRLIDKLMSFFGFAEPAEIASLVAFMASDEARYMSGSVVPIDGAQTAG